AGHLVAAVARERGVLTVGIGDGGNEIGFGNIVEVIREVQPAGRRCLCPCGQGVATVVGTDVLVAAAVSNWGAYGVVAMLAYLLGKPDLVQDDDTEYRMLQAAVAAGASDGVYAAPIMAVDGTSWRVQRALVTMLREIVTNGLTPLGRGF
ncbi:MAG TPA: glutamate cyclase domain-containing protein, partial [Thermomicrobiaceae bacterium]|nr:glutamate cyclase domain-containing protein [Thermomicrobiaceae bacterium]